MLAQWIPVIADRYQQAERAATKAAGGKSLYMEGVWRGYGERLLGG